MLAMIMIKEAQAMIIYTFLLKCLTSRLLDVV